MRLVILSTVHNVAGARGVVYRFFLERLKGVREKHNIDMLVVGSEGSISRDMTESYGAMYLEYQNRPVSNKWAAGLREVKALNPDYVLTLDSDDLLCDKLFGLYISAVETGEYDQIGVTDSYFMDLNNSSLRCGYWKGYTGPSGKLLGCSRIYSKRILEAADWDIWGHGRDRLLNAGTDMIMRRLLVPIYRKKFNVQEEGVLHIDIKSVNNITSMGKLRNKLKPVDAHELLKAHLPRDEYLPILECYDNATT